MVHRRQLRRSCRRDGVRLAAAYLHVLMPVHAFVGPHVHFQSGRGARSPGEAHGRTAGTISHGTTTIVFSTAVGTASPPSVPFVDESTVEAWEVPVAIRRRTHTHTRVTDATAGGGGDDEACGRGSGRSSVVASHDHDAKDDDKRERGYVRMMGLEDVFGGSTGRKLAETFDTDAVFRRALRVAMRDDLFIPDPRRSEKVNRVLTDLGSSLHVRWDASPTGYGNLTSVFASRGIDLDGEAFIKTLGGMAGGGAKVKDQGCYEVHQHHFGSLIDIVNPGSRLKHQDSGLEQTTVMLGFPKTDRYKGAGVFSHAVKLTHQLEDQVEGGGQVIQYEQYPSTFQLPPTLPEPHTIRPWYERGREVMVYDDSWHLHSAPDHIHREAVWRFM